MVNRTRINSAQSILLWNIICHLAISHVANVHHVLGRGFMIQRVILFFMKCLSANQNQLFYMKEQYYLNIDKKPLSTEAKPRFTLVFEGWQFPILPFSAVNICCITLNVILNIHILHYVWFQNNPGQVNI